MLKRISSCRCCGKADFVPLLDMGQMPLANSLHRKGEESERYPLNVHVCSNCWHIQLGVVVDPVILYSDYPYLTGISTDFTKHLKNMAREVTSVMGRWPLKVLDIASNDGTLLAVFKELGCEVCGVDPAANLIPLAEAKGVPTICSFWNVSLAESLKKQFDIITAFNVFAHVDDIRSFIEACSIALKDEGLVVLEFAYAKPLIDNFEFDTIYHEHLSYFTAHSFGYFIQGTDFYIADAKLVPVHGGSIRFCLRKKPGSDCSKMAEIIGEESNLFSPNRYEDFCYQVRKNRKDIRDIVSSFKEANQKVIGFGASAKGNTMINYFDINLDYVVDDTPNKQGKMIAGKNIEILKPEVMADEDKLNIIVLAWNFYDEILARIREIRLNKPFKIVKYIPKAEVIRSQECTRT